MIKRNVCLFFAVVFIIFSEYAVSSEVTTRQKRCIVVQKQSGSRDADDDDQEYEQPQPKVLKPDRIRAHNERRADVEDLPARLLKLNAKPKWLNNRLMLRNKIIRDHIPYDDFTPYLLQPPTHTVQPGWISAQMN